jgi:hypothetical protein
MILHDPHARVATGRLFSTMMVTIILLTTLTLIAFGPRSSNLEAFGGRTPSTTLSPAE